MERSRTVLLLSIMLVVIPLAVPYGQVPINPTTTDFVIEDSNVSQIPLNLDALSGTLDPVSIEHIGTTPSASEYNIGRTDVEPSPGSEAWLPLGSPGNSFSADCDGGHFLVGPGGSTDFSSPSGTISLWLKWDLTAPHGRFWGQHSDFETRWSSNSLVLDWGIGTTFQGTKDDWVPNHWYFIAISWDETNDFIGLFWGDTTQEPIMDASTSSWTGNLTGLHTENNIMNSAARATAQVDGHVDEFRYYSVPRNLEDLISDYNVTLTGTESGLVNYYQFEDDLVDAAGSANLVTVSSSSFSHDVYIGGENWRAEQIEVNVRDLRYLYVMNGSFEEGNPGVNVDWSGDGLYYASGWSTQRRIDSTLGRQRSSYVDASSNYITLENEGYAVGDPIDYNHYNGTSIFWYQSVYNNQSVEDFDFSMNFLYQRGPIGLNFSNIFEFTFEILNGSSVLWNWSIDPTNITQRGIWYTVGPLSVTIPNAPSVFEARLSLKIATPASYIEIPETDVDLDGDSANGQFVTFMIDDVSLVGSNIPTFEEVQLELNLQPVGTLPIIGEYGISSISTNYSYWETATIPLSFTSNASVSFEFSARVSRMTRLYNSSSVTGLEEPGVAYLVEPGERAALSMFSYIPSYPNFGDLGIKIYYPEDWENPTIIDPFGTNVTSQAIINSHFIEIPSGLVDSVGWWKITFESPNYARTFSTQVLEDSGPLWEDSDIFKSNDRIRCEVVLGNAGQLVSSVDDLELTWFLPTGNIWLSEVIDNFNSSTVVSSGTTLGPYNATPGIWTVSVLWSNGSEVAYSYTTFEVRHELTIIANTPNVEVQPGEIFTAAIFVYDQDNGNQIFEGVSVVGNWSTQEIAFNPNLAKGWFEADFNTSLIGTGRFVLIVSVSMPHYEPGELTINVVVPSAEPILELMIRAGILGALAFAVLISGIFITRRFYTSTTTRWNLELLDLENRMDDAKNLIGVLVIHRSMGLPVYSRILKGSFQEALLSSFIAAISQFRTEFSLDEPKWSAIPISEAIMALQTEAFICAIVTVEGASDRQIGQLKSFGLEVGGFYDHDEDVTKQVLQTPERIEHLAEQITPAFEKYFDGMLMKRYVGVKKNLPKRFQPVSQAMKTMDIDHGVSPGAIIKSIIRLGYNERKAHIMVLDALDEGYLIVSEKKLPPPIGPPKK
ncbi:MAG: hypothetical protein ACXAAK_02105 [Candidatus Thorarchaeota archaeon]